MDNSPIMFKSAINGFDKKAVISYIFELNETNQSAQSRMKGQLMEAVEAKEAAERALAEAGKNNPRMQSELDSLNSAIASERAKAAELSDMVGNLNLEVEHLREELALKEAALSTDSGLAGELEEKQRQMSEAQRGLSEKEKEVERASAQIGRLLLDASADAESIRQKAQEEADTILEKVRAEASGILLAATADSEKTAADAKAKAAGLLKEANANLKEAHQRFDFFRQELGSLQATIVSAATSMLDKAEALGPVVDALDKKMAPDFAAGEAEKSGDFFRFE